MKPKQLFLTCLLAIVGSMAGQKANAYDAKIDGIYYVFDESYLGNEAWVTYRSKNTDNNFDAYWGDVNIPNSVTYGGKKYKVTAIGDYAFHGCISVSSVTIPNGVTSIGHYAFWGCGLNTITIPKSVNGIGGSAFRECYLDSVCISDLSAWCKIDFVEYESNPLVCTSKFILNGEEIKDNLVIPNGVSKIGDYAFCSFTGLKSVTIPNSVKSIGINAFRDIFSLRDFYCYAESVPSTASTAFWDTNIKYATLHVPAASQNAYRTTEPWSGFGNIVAIDETPIINFADTNVKAICVAKWDTNHDGELSEAEAAAVTNLGTVFYGNKEICSFNELQYFTGLTSIGPNAFEGSSSLTSINIPNSVTSIDAYAFAYCSSLTSINIPNSVTSIGGAAFDDCTNLASITIPNSVTSIGSSAFNGTAWYYNQPEGLIYAGKVAYIYKGTMPTGTQIIIKDGTLGISDAAFDDCTNLTSVIIPNSVTSIGEGAFFGCTSLTSITIPDGVTSIGGIAFQNCSGLTSVTIGKSVTSIGQYAFVRCSLRDVYCYAENVPETDSNAFKNSPISSALLHVPAGSLESYRTSAPWSSFGNIVAIDETHRIIEDLSELSNNKQYLIHTRDKIRGSLGVINNHLASNNPTVTGPYDCRPVVLDTDNPLITSVNQLSSPNTEPTEGSLADMIDGNTGTFWHSVWSQGAVEAGSHYFQVEMLNQANIDVAFKVTRRQADNDHITEWGVYGTNNANASKEECASLAVIETPYNNRGETRVSNIFNTGGYKYLRFYINRTTRSNFGHVAEFQLYPATFDETRDASPFAIIQKNDGYYLYSVLDKAFITPVNNGNESVHPLLPSDNKMNIYKRDNHFVFDFVETGYTINVNYEPGIAICDYGTLNNWFDDGNLFTIEEVGDFDPTEALAKFATQTQTFTVTYEVMFDGYVVATATEEVANGSALPPVPASLSNKFITLTKTGTHPTTVTEDIAVTYNAMWKGPFEFTKTEESAKWYNLKIRGVWFVSKQDTEPYQPEYSVDEATLATPAYQWAFGGDPYHVKIYNRTTGLNETLTKDGDMAVMRSGDYTWDLLPNNDGFVLRVTGTEYSCINQYGGDNGPLKFWTNSQSLTDDGSTFRVEEVAITSPAIAFADAGVKALCVANWDTNGDGELSEKEAAAVTSLGNVFEEKTNITLFNELQYFTGLTSISNYAFQGCTSLTSITIPNSVTSIGNSAFSGCSGLTSITIPNSVTNIGEWAFNKCSSLTSVTFPENITSINDFTFQYCSRLKSLTIPNSVTSIGGNAFLGCGLTSITFPESLTSIGGSAFSECSGLKSVTIPNSVTSMGGSVFFRCFNLTSVTLSESLTSIGDYTFAECSKLTSIIIPNGVTSIGWNAFNKCLNLTSVSIPQSVTYIEYVAFSYCQSLTDVYCYAENVPTTESSAFNDSRIASATLHVPAASLQTYRTSYPWSSFGTIIPIDGFVINDETTSFSIAVEESGKAVVHTHQFTGDWEALYLPFAIDYDAIRADFDLAEIDGVVQNDDNNDGIADITVLSIMGFKEQMTEPNTPYLIRAKNAGEQTIVFDDVTVYPTDAATFECSSFSKRYEFTGSYNTLGASALANRYVVQGGELVKGASSLAPCRWYMTATSKTGDALNLPNRIRIMPVEDVITGSPLLTSPEEEGLIYKVSGQRLNKKQKGINIKDGKKVLVK